MGATAISMLDGARDLILPADPGRAGDRRVRRGLHLHGTPRPVHDLGRRRRVGTGSRGLHRPVRASPGGAPIRDAGGLLRRCGDLRYDHGEGTAVTVALITGADATPA